MAVMTINVKDDPCISICIEEDDLVYFREDNVVKPKRGSDFIASSIIAKGDFDLVIMKSSKNNKK